MRHSLLILALALFGCSAVTPADKLEDWTLQRAGDSQTYQVKVPCTVAGALNEAGVFGQDVLDRDRYKEIDKTLFDEPWVYTTRFFAQKGKRHVLRFEGLNFYADVELNGHLLASADTCMGAFSVREWDVTEFTKLRNKLKVTVRRAQSGDLNHGFADWNPRPVDENMGIIRPVYLISTPDVQVQDVFVHPLVNPEDLSSARLLVRTTLVNRSPDAVEGSVAGVFEGGEFTLPVSLAGGETREVTADVTVNEPRIWWTAEMGRPELYHLDVAFRTGDQVSHHKSVRFGIRSITSEVDAAGHRQFYLNGRPVLVKAGGWSDDIFLQDTPEDYEEQVKMTLDMGLNCIRFENIWGKDDTVYDFCDSLGVLAMVGWSCQWEWEDYCGLKETRGYGCINDPRSEALAVRYFHDQVIRLRNHPALIGWLTGSDRIPNPRLEEQYLAIWDKEEYRPYICSAKALTSLAGPSGMKMEGPYEYVGPDYWWVDTECGGAFGFNTETGPGLNIPQEESLRQMLGQENLWPVNEMWNYHCTASSSHMNDTRVLDKAMAAVYGQAADFQDYLRKAHALNYDATRSMFEAFRGNVPGATGIVMWMLNSAWPSLYWQFYDWYDVPTAAYFGTKAACRPLQLVYNYKDHTVVSVNDAQPDTPAKARLRVYAADGKTLLRDETRQIVLRERQPEAVFSGIAGPCFVALELNGEPVNFYAIPEKGNRYDFAHADWWGLPILEYADLRFVTALPKASVHRQIRNAGDGLDVTLVNESDVIAHQVIVKAIDDDGLLFPGVVWSDNFVTLLPGETRTLHCSLPVGSDHAHIGLAGWNVEL